MYWLHWKYYKRDYNLWLDWVILWYGVPLPNQDGFRSSKLLFYTSTVFVVIVVLINTTITTSDAAIKEMPTIRNSNQYWIVGEKKYEIPKWLTLCKEALDGWAWWGPGYRWLAGRHIWWAVWHPPPPRIIVECYAIWCNDIAFQVLLRWIHPSIDR